MYQEVVEQLAKKIEESSLEDHMKEEYRNRLFELTKIKEENEQFKEMLESFVDAPVDSIKIFFDTIDAMIGAYAEGGAEGAMDAAGQVVSAVDSALE